MHKYMKLFFISLYGVKGVCYGKQYFDNKHNLNEIMKNYDINANNETYYNLCMAGFVSINDSIRSALGVSKFKIME